MGKIGVLGGGLSGLSFASLVKSSEVLEKETEFGGLARSIREQGYIFDLGSHIIFSNNQKILDFMLALLGENKIRHRRTTKILYNGKYVKYPFENGLGDLPLVEALGCAYDYILAQSKNKKPKNFKEWMYCRFGKSIADKYLYPYNSKIWDYPPENMGAFWVEGRVPQPPLMDVLKAALRLGSEGYTHQLNFYYPKTGGYEALVKSLLGRIEKSRLINEFNVVSIKKEGDGWLVKNKKGKERIYDKLVSTLHIRDFIKCYEGADSEIRKTADSLRWNSMHLVMFGIKKQKLNDIHWCYIPDSKILPNRISFPSNYSPFVAPAGHSSVLAEVTFAPHGEKAKLTKSEVLERTIDDLHGLGIFDRKDIVFAKVVTSPYAYVVYDADYQENISKIYRFAESEGITLLGRFSEFKYINADKCMESAMEKAKLFL